MADLRDLEIIRRTVARELETISQYEKDAAAATDERVRTFLAHLAHEEKEHVAEGMAMLALLDDRQAALQEKGAHFLPGDGSPEAPVPPEPDPAPEPSEEAGAPDPAVDEAEMAEVPALFRTPSRLTVGSLKKVRRSTDRDTPSQGGGPDRRR